MSNFENKEYSKNTHVGELYRKGSTYVNPSVPVFDFTIKDYCDTVVLGNPFIKNVSLLSVDKIVEKLLVIQRYREKYSEAANDIKKIKSNAESNPPIKGGKREKEINNHFDDLEVYCRNLLRDIASINPLSIRSAANTQRQKTINYIIDTLKNYDKIENDEIEKNKSLLKQKGFEYGKDQYNMIHSMAWGDYTESEIHDLYSSITDSKSNRKLIEEDIKLLEKLKYSNGGSINAK